MAFLVDRFYEATTTQLKNHLPTNNGGTYTDGKGLGWTEILVDVLNGQPGTQQLRCWDYKVHQLGGTVPVGGWTPPTYTSLHRNETDPGNDDYGASLAYARLYAMKTTGGTQARYDANIQGVSILVRVTPTGTSPSGISAYIGTVWYSYNASTNVNTVNWQIARSTGSWPGVVLQAGSQAAVGNPSYLELRSLSLTVSDYNAASDQLIGFTGTYDDFYGSASNFSISYTDSSASKITARGRIGIALHGNVADVVTSGWTNINGMLSGNISLVNKTSTDTLLPILGDDATTKAVIVSKTSTDTLLPILGEAQTKDSIVFKTSTDTLLPILTEAPVPAPGEAGGPITRNSAMVRAGLLSSVEPSLVLDYWPAATWVIPGVPTEAMALGTTVSYTESQDTINTGAIFYASAIPDTAFEGVIAAHLGSLFPSARDQRGSMRLFLTASLESYDDSGGPAAASLRGVLRSPAGTFPITQDPASHAVTSPYGFRRMDIGLFSWPPSSGGASKYRSDKITHRLTVLDLNDMALIEVQALSQTETAAQLRLLAMDVLPVEDGFFALMSTTNSEESALHQGEILVMDTIDKPVGGYIVKQAEGATALRENIDLSSSSAAPVVGSGFYLKPRDANLITFLYDNWNEDDDAGVVVEAATFNAWIEYQPRQLYF